MNLEWLRLVVTSILLAFLSIVGTGCANGVDEKPAPSIASDTTDWELLGNSSDMQHHSGLSQINTETVSDLGLAWARDRPLRMSSTRLERLHGAALTRYFSSALAAFS